MDRHPRDCGKSDSLDAPFEAFLDSKAVTGSGESRSGTYTAQLERVVGEWLSRMMGRGIESFQQLDEQWLARWADEYLAQRVRAHRATDGESGLSAHSAHTYFDCVSAYLTYCRRWGIIEENPADTAIAREPLPARPSRQASDQQFWSPAQRERIVAHVREEATAALEQWDRENPVSARMLKPCRDLALVSVLGYSGVRGGEILRLPRGDDDRRTGVTWSALDFEGMTLEVLGKDQDYEQVPLTDRPLPALKRLHTLLDPASEEWPLFPTLHAPTLWSTLRSGLAAKGRSEAEIERITDELPTALAGFREYDIVVPSMTTEGARHRLKRLTNAAEIDVEGPKSYLTLHGARRGVGEQYYREVSAAAAQRVLRHADPRTTSEMYAHIEASELSEIGSEVFE